MSDYAIGPSVVGLVNATTLLGTGPRSVYAPGAELVATHGGGLVAVGYPRSILTFKAVTIEDYADALQTTLSWGVTDYSGSVYVTTRNEFDDWATYSAILRLPDPQTLQRWGGHYLDVPWTFILIEEQP